MGKAVTLWHQFQPIAAWILVSLIPSVITGLSQFPKTKGIAAALQKVLQFVSVLTHSDQAGTFKAPLTLVPAPGGKS